MTESLDPIPHLEAGERAGDDTCIIAMRVIREVTREARRHEKHVEELIAGPFKREEGLRASLDASQRELRAAEARLESVLAAARYATDRDNMVMRGLFALAPLRRALAELDA